MRSGICPDFYVGKEPWKPSDDWSTFPDWLKDRKPTDINRQRTQRHPSFAYLNVTVEHLKRFDYYVFKSDFCLVSAEKSMQC